MTARGTETGEEKGGTMSTKCYECGTVMKEKKITHHYKESGLDNVYLEGVSEFVCPECKARFVDMPRPVQLHIVLAIALSFRKSMLTGPEIRFMRKEVGMTGKAFAEFIGVNSVTLSRWENAPDDANKEESNDRLIRFAFKVMMYERLRAMLSWMEAQIQQSKVVSFHNERVDVDADAMKYVSIPESSPLSQQTECA